MGIRTKFASLGGSKVYVEKAWTQTILTSNGTMGGTSCACTSSEVDKFLYGNYGPAYLDAFRAFNGMSASTVCINNWKTQNACVLTSSMGFITYYTPTPIKVSKITFEKPSIGAIFGIAPPNNAIWMALVGGVVDRASVYGSNDNENWTLLKTADTPSGVIDDIQSPDFYKYIKIQSLATGNGNGAIFVNVKIEAVYRE